MGTKEIFWCNNCLNISTRPRISFDQRGFCNACQWMEEKKQIDWTLRQAELNELLLQCKARNAMFDCIVPVSGGKDGSYVAHTLKHKYHMNILTVTVRPVLSLEIGNKNLHSFIQTGYNHIHISTNSKAMDLLNKYGFFEKGFPYYGWLIAIRTAVIQLAVRFNIPLIFYGEDGEVEYGGSTENKNRAFYDIACMKRIYLEGGHDHVLQKATQQSDVSKADLSFFQFPDEETVAKCDLKFTHWSYFEPWDSYRNYIVAKEYCGLIEKEEGNHGTFTNFAQNDQALYLLHTYLMYLKFGFGRATQDVGIEIRRGAMSREQGIHLVNMYDNTQPHEYMDMYLQYYNMSQYEFNSVLDKFVNKNLFEKNDGVWQPKFTIGKNFHITEELVA